LNVCALVAVVNLIFITNMNAHVVCFHQQAKQCHLMTEVFTGCWYALLPARPAYTTTATCELRAIINSG